MFFHFQHLILVMGNENTVALSTPAHATANRLAEAGEWAENDFQ
jgi:hypothetical protein